MTPVLEARSVHQHYGGIHALRGASLALLPGQVHALIGANGAGKSTLCRIIAGAESPASGELLVDGAPVVFTSVRDAVTAGIEMVHQEFSLFPELNIVENLFLGREIVDRVGLISYRAQVAKAREALARLGCNLDLGMKLGDLPLGLRQIVEITKALVHDARVVLMDEPTSALSPAEIPVLFEVIRSLAASQVAIVYISHRLDELLTISDAVTVMRDGQVVATERCDLVDTRWIVRHMTGRPEGIEMKSAPELVGDTLLSVSDLTLPARAGRSALLGISLEVSAGEIVGLFGFMGAGRTELFEALMGLYPEAQGRVSLSGVDLHSLDVAGRMARGLLLVPEDRRREGLVPTLSVMQNMTLASLERFTSAGRIRAKERDVAREWVDSLKVKLGTLDQPVLSLSGGNQQKVVLARCLMASPRVLLLDEPSRGVDVAAKQDIMNQMRMRAAEGMGILFASSDASEILAIATRVVVMSRGRVVLDVPVAEATEEALTMAAAMAATEPDGVRMMQ